MEEFSKNYALNPHTNRPIHKSSLMYKTLVKNGVILHDFDEDECVICKIEEGDNVKQLKKMFDDEQKDGVYFACLGRGMYQGYLVKRKRRENKVKNKMEHMVKEVLNKSKEILDLQELTKVCIENTENKFNTKCGKYYLEM